MKYISIKNTTLRINHRKIDLIGRTGLIKWVKRGETILPFIQYLFSLEPDCTETKNCCMPSGYCFHGCWAGSVLGVALDSAGGCSCQQLPGQTTAWAPQHGLRNRGLLSSNRWLWPNLLSPCCISNTPVQTVLLGRYVFCCCCLFVLLYVHYI